MKSRKLLVSIPAARSTLHNLERLNLTICNSLARFLGRGMITIARICGNICMPLTFPGLAQLSHSTFQVFFVI